MKFSDLLFGLVFLSGVVIGFMLVVFGFAMKNTMAGYPIACWPDWRCTHNCLLVGLSAKMCDRICLPDPMPR